jgi:uncharacterized membrane protein
MLEITHLIRYLLWFGAIGCGLLAGVYFAFSTFIMTAFDRIEPAHGVSAMNSINSTILHSLFMPFFYGTTIVSLAFMVIALFRRGEPGATLMLAGALIYIVSMTLCTIFFNVPLNNVLTGIDPAKGTGISVWSHYLRVWTLWNHVRTISSTATCALYIAAIAAK